MYMYAYHANDALDGFRGDLLAAGPLHEDGAQVLEEEGDTIAHRLLVTQPVLAQF
jgi:hypothetical protein